MNEANDNQHQVLQYLCSSHQETATTRFKELTALSLTVLLVSLGLVSLLLGYESSLFERSAIAEAKNKLDTLVASNDLVKNLNMKQFLGLSATQQNHMKEILAYAAAESALSIEMSVRSTVRKVKLGESGLDASEIVKDYSTIEDLVRTYSGMKWGDFASIKEKRSILNLLVVPAPKDKLIELMSRYGLLDSLSLPRRPSDHVRPLLAACFEVVKNVRDQHKVILEHLGELYSWDSSVLDLPVRVFLYDISGLQVAYWELIEAVGIRDDRSELYGMTAQESKPEKAIFGAVYARLTTKAASRLDDLEAKLSASIQGLTIQFPLRPIALMFPFMMVVYFLAVTVLHLEKRRHYGIAEKRREELESFAALGSAKSSPEVSSFLGKIFSLPRNVAGWIAEPGNLQFVIMQAAVLACYAYILLSAFGIAVHAGWSFTWRTTYMIGVVLLNLLTLFTGIALKRRSLVLVD